MTEQKETDQLLEKREWYKRWWGIVIAVILLPFFGLWYAWFKSGWKWPSKVIVSFFCLMIIIGALNGDSTPTTVADKRVEDKPVQSEEAPSSVVEQPIAPVETITVKEEPKPVAVVQEATELVKEVPQPAPQPSTIDRLWSVLDSTIRTREGYDIQYTESTKFVNIISKGGSYWDETDYVRSAINSFVKYDVEAFKIDGVDSVNFTFYTDMTDSYGKTESEKGVQLTIDETEFSKYDWQGLQGQNIYRQMVNSANLWVHAGIMKNVKTEKLILVL